MTYFLNTAIIPTLRVKFAGKFPSEILRRLRADYTKQILKLMVNFLLGVFTVLHISLLNMLCPFIHLFRKPYIILLLLLLFARKKRNYTKILSEFFFYKDVPANVYPLGIILNEYENYSYQIASPEKAICDELYSLSPTKNLTELKELLFDNLRIDESAFNNLNKQDLLNLASLYHSTNLKLLIKLINKEK